MAIQQIDRYPAKERVMKRLIIMGVLSMFVTVAIVTGCSYTSVTSPQCLAVPIYPPTDPATVQILHTEPTKPHERLGEVSLEPEGNPPVAEMEAKLRASSCQDGGERSGDRRGYHPVDGKLRDGAMVGATGVCPVWPGYPRRRHKVSRVTRWDHPDVEELTETASQ
jgi:hypothetical protein